MTNSEKKQLVNAAIQAWLSVESSVRAVREYADEIGLSLTDQQVADVLLAAQKWARAK